MAYNYYGKSYEEAMSDLEKRKEYNLTNNLDFYKYSPLIVDGKYKCLVAYDDYGEIKKCLCSKCLSSIDRSPYYNTKYVYPLCRSCIIDVFHIEDQNKKDQKMNQRNKRSDPSAVSVDWTSFESLMASGNAKLCELAKQYNVYPSDMKNILIKKYDSHIVFKKGRNGGIYWATRV